MSLTFSSLISSYNSSKGKKTTHNVIENANQHPLYSSLKEIWKNNNSNENDRFDTNLISSNIGRYKNGLGILLIIIDELPHEAIWRVWLECGYHSYELLKKGIPSVKFWIHAKFPERVRSSWVRKRLVKDFHLKPSWGSVELTEVMIRMLIEATATDDHTISKYCFASESCVPILPLIETLKLLQIDDEENDDFCNCNQDSWLSYTAEPTNGYAKQGQFDALKDCFPKESILKSDQWIMISRFHATQVISIWEALLRVPLTDFLELFHKVHASDEMFFPSCLCLLGCMRPRPQTEQSTTSHNNPKVLKRRLTHCRWVNGEKGPQTSLSLTHQDVTEAIEAGCVFYRKLKYSKQHYRNHGNDQQHQQLLRREVDHWFHTVQYPSMSTVDIDAGAGAGSGVQCSPRDRDREDMTSEEYWLFRIGQIISSSV